MSDAVKVLEKRQLVDTVGSLEVDTPLGHETIEWVWGSCGVFKFCQGGKYFVFAERGRDDKSFLAVHGVDDSSFRPSTSDEQETALRRMRDSNRKFPNGNLMRLINTAEKAFNNVPIVDCRRAVKPVPASEDRPLYPTSMKRDR